MKRWEEKKPFLKPEVLGAGFVALTSLLLYLNTLAPTVLTFDSATLQTRAYVLGIGYPTGYPTYIMLGKLFTYLPFGDVAYRVNLSSAVYGSLAGVIIYLTALRTIPGRRNALAHGTAILAALALLTGPTFWSQAVIAEVYTLNILFVTSTLYSLLAWRDTSRDRYLIAAAFFTGLAMTDHMTSGLLIPAALIFVLLVDPNRLTSLRFVAKGLGAFIIGLSPYLYLPIRASMDPPANYANPSNLQNFWFILSGGNFKGQMFVYGLNRLPERLVLYTEELLRQFPLVLLAGALVGLVLLFLRDRALAVFLTTLMLGYLVFALEYGISDIYPYFIPTYLLLALFLAAGLGWFLESLGRMAWMRSLPRGLAPATVLVFVLVVVALGALDTRTQVDQSGNYEFRQVLESVAADTQKGSAVMGQREISTLRYMQLVEGRRKDLDLRAVTTSDVAHYTSKVIQIGAVYFVKPGATSVGRIREAGYDIYPVERGILYEVRPRNEV